MPTPPPPPPSIQTKSPPPAGKSSTPSPRASTSFDFNTFSITPLKTPPSPSFSSSFSPKNNTPNANANANANAKLTPPAVKSPNGRNRSQSVILNSSTLPLQRQNPSSLSTNTLTNLRRIALKYCQLHLKSRLRLHLSRSFYHWFHTIKNASALMLIRRDHVRLNAEKSRTRSERNDLLKYKEEAVRCRCERDALEVVIRGNEVKHLGVVEGIGVERRREEEGRERELEGIYRRLVEIEELEGKAVKRGTKLVKAVTAGKERLIKGGFGKEKKTEAAK